MEYINLKDGYTKEDIDKTSEIIKNGKIAIIPTDTVYGIAADALNEEAVKKIYRLKHRDLSKPCSILVSDIDMIKQVTKSIRQFEERIIKKFFPGALTIVLEKNEKIPNAVTANQDTVGVRIPDNKFLIELIKTIGRPIVATSLNLSGEESKTSIQNIPDEIKQNVDLIVDAGETKVGKASTVVKVKNNKIEILREGPITKEEILKVGKE